MLSLMDKAFLRSSFVPPPAGGPLDFSTIGTGIVDLEGDEGITQVSLDISDWVDQFGNGNDMEQATGVAQPVLVQNDPDFNGHDSVQFDGAETFMDLEALAGGDVAQPVTFFIVAKYDDTAGIEYIFSGQSTTSRMTLNTFPGTVFNMYAGAPSNPGPSRDTDTHVFALVFDGSGSTAGYVDGDDTDWVGSVGTQDFQDIVLGASHLENDHLNGKIARFIAYDGLLSTTNMNLAGNELASLYGTTWSDI